MIRTQNRFTTFLYYDSTISILNGSAVYYNFGQNGDTYICNMSVLVKNIIVLQVLLRPTRVIMFLCLMVCMASLICYLYK